MGIRKNRGNTLRRIFMKNIFYLGAFITILILANYLVFIIASLGVYPANYSERIIQRNYDELKNAPKVTMDLLTPMCSFGIYSETGGFLYGNFPPKYIDAGWDSYKQGKKTIGLSDYIISVEREEDVLIISYPLNMQFTNDGLRKTLPNAELTIIILFLFQLFVLIIMWSSRLAKRINEELGNLLYSVKRIEEQNLDFDVGASNIEEINLILQGIDTMKNSLKATLEEQWNLEKKKKEQISALAHDVRTPLTIVKGNVGLLKETDVTNEQKSYCNYIEKSSNQMEEYLQKLLSITKEEIDNSEVDNIINIRKLISSLKNQGEVLGRIKDISIICNLNIGEGLYLKGNEFELERAFMNLITNAVNFSPNNSTIIINANIKNRNLIIEVKDEGEGFSEKILKHGKEQFFMEDESRTKSGHYGLGLYITNSIIKNYNGELILSNDKNGGGTVNVIMPLERGKNE
ncbi:MAG: HAMP domain-containing histidine kinase [Clostridiales bacterium]|nr:HAMP domain-containing histidine kinase [Clostridiales bacterium]